MAMMEVENSLSATCPGAGDFTERIESSLALMPRVVVQVTFAAPRPRPCMRRAAALSGALLVPIL